MTCSPKEPPPRFSYQAILPSPEEAEEDVGVAVPVRSVAYTPSAVRGPRDHLLHAEGTAPEVLVPGDLVVEEGGREDVGVPVSVQVRGVYGRWRCSWG